MTSSILYHRALTLPLLLILHGHPKVVIKAPLQESKLPQTTIKSVPSSGLCNCQHVQAQQYRYSTTNLGSNYLEYNTNWSQGLIKEVFIHIHKVYFCKW